ncbi:uncharacterized protein LOC116962468 [Tyto alba]|uniref:uncharacterized protein LOC116962468 n=1 Tax=Tyto alba TaxID=56313 RepID=UPI001C6664EB|nr:uncharacterized protein LOC116962468 [Tyto alba]
MPPEGKRSLPTSKQINYEDTNSHNAETINYERLAPPEQDLSHLSETPVLNGPDLSPHSKWALLKTWDLDARGHVSVEGKCFSEGVSALCWAGLKLYWLRALQLRWPFLLCITCIWSQNQYREAKNPTTLRCRPRQSPKPQLQTGEQIGSSARACPAAAPRSQQCRLEGDAPAQEVEVGPAHSSRVGDADGNQLRGGSEHLTQT